MKIGAFIIMLTLAAPAMAEPLPPLLKEIESKYAAAVTLLVRFKQVNDVAAMKQRKVSSGMIAAKRPNKIRWETLEPDPNLLVSDGRVFWFYTPPFDKDERGQLIKRRTSQVQSRVATALLSGAFSIAKDMKIKRKNDTTFTLTPKPGTAGTVKRAEISVNLQKKIIERVILEHKGGNRSEITLSSIELGKKLGDEMFVFTAPPSTDLVEE
ncbi:MAG: outer membrane lipoprotein carrier protein LolA [Bdellovibrionales bacterium RIFOXYD1_FULL_53_11]|nr:MAG: outer membrane lipoprotein carrier protein LolA [Bdellovibrionales bacterium RIFOXYD1_FULL_53_11]